MQDRVRNDSTREMKKIPNVDEIIMEGDGNGLYMSAQPRGKIVCDISAIVDFMRAGRPNLLE